jgi:hypothetical protein
MLREMPSDLYEHWIAYGRLKPFGHENRLLAQQLAMTYNIHRGDNPPFETEDYLPTYKTEYEMRKQAEMKMLQEMEKK